MKCLRSWRNRSPGRLKHREWSWTVASNGAARLTDAQSSKGSSYRTVRKHLPQQFLDHLAAGLRKLLEPPPVEVRELVVVQAEDVQQRHVQILDWMHDFDGRVSDLVRCAHDVPGLHPAAREKHRLRVRVVIAPDRDPASPMMIVRTPPELPQPHDQRIVQQPALPQILDQCRHRLVDAVDACLVGSLKIVVRVPAAREDLHEPYALLDHAPG